MSNRLCGQRCWCSTKINMFWLFSLYVVPSWGIVFVADSWDFSMVAKLSHRPDSLLCIWWEPGSSPTLSNQFGWCVGRGDSEVSNPAHLILLVFVDHQLKGILPCFIPLCGGVAAGVLFLISGQTAKKWWAGFDEVLWKIKWLVLAGRWVTGGVLLISCDMLTIVSQVRGLQRQMHLRQIWSLFFLWRCGSVSASFMGCACYRLVFGHRPASPNSGDIQANLQYGATQALFMPLPLLEGSLCR